MSIETQGMSTLKDSESRRRLTVGLRRNAQIR